MNRKTERNTKLRKAKKSHVVGDVTVSETTERLRKVIKYKYKCE
jgi:hypothetical protein